MSSSRTTEKAWSVNLSWSVVTLGRHWMEPSPGLKNPPLQSQSHAVLPVVVLRYASVYGYSTPAVQVMQAEPVGGWYVYWGQPWQVEVAASRW